MLKPALQVALLFRIIFAFEVFASVIAITGRAKTTLAGEALRWQGEYLDPHVAAAYALLILVALARRRRHRRAGPADAEGAGCCDERAADGSALGRARPRGRCVYVASAVLLRSRSWRSG